MSSEAPFPGDDEFRFLTGDAARVHRTAPLPRVERVSARVTDGRAMSGLRFGAPEDPELVVLHGAGLNAHSFDPALLAFGRPALALDLPGHGRSDWRDDADYRPHLLAADIVSALDRLAPAPVTLLGHSLGGLAAALVAQARPERVRRLVMVDITPGITPGGDAGAVVEFITGQRHYGSVDEIVDRAIRFGIGSDRAALTRGVALNTRRRPDGRLEWTHHLAHLDALPGSADGDPHPYSPIWSALQTLEAPVTLVRAQHGILNNALVEEWRERLPGTEIITVPGPHNLHEADPELLASIVRDL
ncbi:alpha/beta fold hydrolase [Leucobacter chironomi]|uniref:alpha/beta fold hydrolase n=1 Tax=Leucobacter chironomi TaxID=491918 RepID=UPI00041269CD|nr:alpha/beta fold hydrolase [Leucobacter chironomi]